MADQFYYNNAYFAGSDVIGETAELYEVRAGVSIESNMFYGVFWLVKNGTVVSSGLGDCEFRIFDRDGNLVAGLAETGIAADAEGHFIITPVSAANLIDQRHYVIEATISYAGQDRVSKIPIGIAE